MSPLSSVVGGSQETSLLPQRYTRYCGEDTFLWRRLANKGGKERRGHYNKRFSFRPAKEAVMPGL